jgi:hypothetical protein
MKLEHMQAFIDKFRYFCYYLDIMPSEPHSYSLVSRLSIRWNLFKRSLKTPAAFSFSQPLINSDLHYSESKMATSATKKISTF